MLYVIYCIILSEIHSSLLNHYRKLNHYRNSKQIIQFILLCPLNASIAQITRH